MDSNHDGVASIDRNRQHRVTPQCKVSYFPRCILCFLSFHYFLLRSTNLHIMFVPANLFLDSEPLRILSPLSMRSRHNLTQSIARLSAKQSRSARVLCFSYCVSCLLTVNQRKIPVMFVGMGPLVNGASITALTLCCRLIALGPLGKQAI